MTRWPISHGEHIRHDHLSSGSAWGPALTASHPALEDTRRSRVRGLGRSPSFGKGRGRGKHRPVTGTRIEPETVLRLAEHPRIAGVKDCAYDLLGSSKVIAETGLAYYSGVEELILPLRAVGGVGYVSTVANVAGPAVAAVLDAFDRADTAEATRRHQRLLPLVQLMMAAGLPGTVTAKALLNALALPGGPVRAPLRMADADRTAELVAAYAAL